MCIFQYTAFSWTDGKKKHLSFFNIIASMKKIEENRWGAIFEMIARWIAKMFLKPGKILPS